MKEQHLTPKQNLQNKLTQPLPPPTKQTLVIIDGAQGTGKTTITQQLQNNHGYTIQKFNHRTQPLNQTLHQLNQPTIYDRGFLSPYIYNMLWNTQGIYDKTSTDTPTTPDYQPIAWTDITQIMNHTMLHIILYTNDTATLAERIEHRNKTNGRTQHEAEKHLLHQSNRMFYYHGLWLTETFPTKTKLVNIDKYDTANIIDLVVLTAKYLNKPTNKPASKQ